MGRANYKTLNEQKLIYIENFVQVIFVGRHAPQNNLENFAQKFSTNILKNYFRLVTV